MLLSRISFLRIAALCAGAGASVAAAYAITGEVETRTRQALTIAVDEAGYGWAQVQMDGLRAIFSGEAPDEATRFRVLAEAGKLVNPANLRDRMTVAQVVEAPPPEYRLEMLRNGDDITVHGLMPGDENAQQSLMAILGAITPAAEVSDLLSGSGEAPPPNWTQAMELGIEALMELESTRVLVTPDRLEITGLAADRTSANDFERGLRADVPEGLDLQIALRLPRPVISPFTTRVHATPEGLRLDACATDGPEGHAAIEAAARESGFKGNFSCVEGLGSPDPSWNRVVTTGIAQLGKLGAGTLTVSDLNVSLVGAPGTDAGALAQAKAALERELPAIYTVTLVQPPAETKSVPAEERVEFTASISPEGLVDLRGPVADEQSRLAVQSYAASRFGTTGLTTALRLKPDLPNGWAMRVLTSLDGLAGLENGHVEISPDTITLAGISHDPDAQANIAGALQKALGTAATFTLDVTYEEPPAPVVMGLEPAECVAQINAAIADNKINFAPGSDDLDSSAYSTIQRIAGILRECPDVPMEIGGHTDSQGREEMNQQLSMTRAQSVLNALMARRVLVGNLSAVGYGESQPIADNGSEDGRETNRRIEFRLAGDLAEPVDSEGATVETPDEDAAPSEDPASGAEVAPDDETPGETDSTGAAGERENVEVD